MAASILGKFAVQLAYHRSPVASPQRDSKILEANPLLHFTILTMASQNHNRGPTKYVTLVSSDGFEFVVLREAACISGAIKRMLDPKSERNHL